MAVATSPKFKESQTRVAIPQIRDAVTEVYLITGAGLYELGGQDAYEVAQKIEKDKVHSLLDYRHYDDDKRTWAYWAVEDAAEENGIRPVVFPDLQQYSLTSPQLYTKAVTYPRVLAHAVALLKEKPSTMWDKMLKPTTIILAIVGIVFVMMLGLVALSG